MRRLFLPLALLLALAASAPAQPKKPLSLMDVFSIEYASDPQITANGKWVVYVRNFMDVMKDRRRSNLWIVNADGTARQPLTTGAYSDSSPRLAPDGKRLVFVSDRSGTPQLHVLWLATGRTTKITDLPAPPFLPSWSPDGKHIAFVSLVAAKPKPFVDLPARPEGAEWAAPFKMIRNVGYRFDGKGYLKEGFYHLFVVSADGGPARQVTDGPYHDSATSFGLEEPAWTPDSRSLIFAANRSKDADYHPLETELYEASLEDGKVTALTDRRGPDHSPAVSRDGAIAYLGFDDKKLGYQNTRLYLLNRGDKTSRCLTPKLDRSVRAPRWAADGKSVYFLYDDDGDTKIGQAMLDGGRWVLANHVGGESPERPYAAGAFSVSDGGVLAFTQTSPTQPAEIALADPSSAPKTEDVPPPRAVTALNKDLFETCALASTVEIRAVSSHDKRDIQAWVMTPPGFDAKKKYPLILEIHGGPFANYGPRFSIEMQLYAAAGYVVLYVNPRGSTSYGEAFANLIHHNYPGNDYDDLMSAVDDVIKRGYINPDRLFITGGSGGGVLTAWSIGKTKRFRAAVVGKPVIDWHSFVLTADAYPFFAQYWFPAPPWEDPEHYRKRSPLSLVGAVSTPTMLMTGEEDHRTPIAQSEQYYQALKLRKVPAALVRIPGASHNTGARPSHIVAKVAYVLGWFREWDK
ncbi:MAG: S9 family peptidase [Gemmataceae bacterium]